MVLGFRPDYLASWRSQENQSIRGALLFISICAGLSAPIFFYLDSFRDAFDPSASLVHRGVQGVSFTLVVSAIFFRWFERSAYDYLHYRVIYLLAGVTLCSFQIEYMFRVPDSPRFYHLVVFTAMCLPCRIPPLGCLVFALVNSGWLVFFSWRSYAPGAVSLIPADFSAQFITTALVVGASFCKTAELFLLQKKLESSNKTLKRQQERLAQKAAQGHLISTFVHEIDNLLACLELTMLVKRIKRKKKGLTAASTDDESMDAETRCELIAEGAINQIKRLRMITLSGRDGDAQAPREATAVSELMHDLKLLSINWLRGQGVSVEVTTAGEADSYEFSELKGSGYFILQNFIKNAARAVLEKTSTAPGFTPLITFRFAVIDRSNASPEQAEWLKTEDSGRLLKIDIKDNGVGIDKGALKALLAAATDPDEAIKKDGVGLGFVAEQCRKHGYYYQLSSELGSGSTASLIIPGPVKRQQSPAASSDTNQKAA